MGTSYEERINFLKMSRKGTILDKQLWTGFLNYAKHKNGKLLELNHQPGNKLRFKKFRNIINKGDYKLMRISMMLM